MQRGETSLDVLLERVRETFGMQSAALLERHSDVDPRTCAGSAGAGPAQSPEGADVDLPVGDHLALALPGRVLPTADRRVTSPGRAERAASPGPAAAADGDRPGQGLAEGNRIRAALLAAVSHGLRTPLAGIRAAVSSLRSEDVACSGEDQADLLETIEEGADRLDLLVGNLLDMSRLQTGTVTPAIHEAGLDELVPMALGGVPEDSVELDIPETLPMVHVDKGLLERAVAKSAGRSSPAFRPRPHPESRRPRGLRRRAAASAFRQRFPELCQQPVRRRPREGRVGVAS